MIIFSNGKEWNEQSEKYCNRCVNYRDRRDGRGVGCPIEDMHIECSDLNALEVVIPPTMIGICYEFPHCSMFLEVTK